MLDLTDVVTEATTGTASSSTCAAGPATTPPPASSSPTRPPGCPIPATTAAACGRRSGSPTAPRTWDDLLRGGAEIKRAQGVQLGIGMSQEIDSNMAGRALLWSFGASIQDENEQVVINSPQTVEAVDFMTRLYREAMTPEVFSWNAASNNQGLAAGQLSYILNSISAWRTSQETDPEVADDIFFTLGAARSRGRPRGQPRHVQLDHPELRREPGRGEGVPAALHGQPGRGRVELEALRLPRLRRRRARPRQVAPERPVRRPSRRTSWPCSPNAIDWSTNIGYPGPPTPPRARCSRPSSSRTCSPGPLGVRSPPQQAVADAEAQIRPIFDQWRARGLIGSGGS